MVDVVCLGGSNLVLSLRIYSLLRLFEQLLPSLCVYLSPYVYFNKKRRYLKSLTLLLKDTEFHHLLSCKMIH